MFSIYPSNERGHTQLDWLDSYHTFSFSEFYDVRRMGFRSLRVINEDYVQPSKGFSTHPHRDVEILTWVLDGELEHQDSLGTGRTLKQGEMQRMSAGQGILHSEWNPSPTNPVHFLQIWITPDQKGLKPEYEYCKFSVKPTPGVWLLLASGADAKKSDSLFIHQDVNFLNYTTKGQEEFSFVLSKDRFVWIQVVRGKIQIGGKQELVMGDAAAIENESEIYFKSLKPQSQILLWDLA